MGGLGYSQITYLEPIGWPDLLVKSGFSFYVRSTGNVK